MTEVAPTLPPFSGADRPEAPPRTAGGPELPRDAVNLELLTPAGPVALGFVAEGSAVFLVGRERSARWPVTTMRAGTAHIRFPGGTTEGPISLITDPAEKRRVLGLFRAKYGDRRFERWYDHPARILRLETRGGPTSMGFETSPYYDWLTAEFDNVADDYDHHITGNRINLLLRNRSLAQLRRTFRSSRSLLEIGCGSGMETLPLLADGHELLCVDISSRMLETVRSKARAEGSIERLRTRRLRASDLGTLLREVGEAEFDGGYSTYGALNCEEDLSPIPPALHSLFRPDGRFVAGVYNRWCLFETVGYALSGQPGRAFGRTHRPVPVGSSRFCVDIFAHSSSDFRRLFRPWFESERVEAIPVILPPSDLVGYAEKFSRHFDRLAAWDRSIASRWPLRELGDHFLMTFARRELTASTPAVAGAASRG
ncbi:MAG: methyltransferase domain-containing protein [Thermoplasmata archaeon]